MSLASYTIERNEYLNTSVRAFYHTDYLRHGVAGNPDYLLTLKNNFRNTRPYALSSAQGILKDIFKEDLQTILNLYTNANSSFDKLAVCVVPRSKASFNASQLGFSKTINNVVNSMGSDKVSNLTNGIVRVHDTCTYHMKNYSGSGYDNHGSLPYKGIAMDTCRISNAVRGRDILLVDDIYTKKADIIEDMTQALYDKGANTVFVYTVGRTVRKYR